MFVSHHPPIFRCGNLVPNVMVLGGGAFGRCLGHEGGAFRNGISALLRTDFVRAPSPLLLCEDVAKRQPSTNQQADSFRHQIFWHLDLRSPASRTMRNKFLLFISHSASGIVFSCPRICGVLKFM